MEQLPEQLHDWKTRWNHSLGRSPRARTASLASQSMPWKKLLAFNTSGKSEMLSDSSEAPEWLARSENRWKCGEPSSGTNDCKLKVFKLCLQLVSPRERSGGSKANDQIHQVEAEAAGPGG